MPNSCFLNNHFCLGHMENMDIQPVFNHCKAVAYICAYFPNLKVSVMKQAMKQAVWNAFMKKLNNYQQMKSVASTYINKRECSIQECVYYILPSLRLRKTFPSVIFANSNMLEKRFSVCLGEDKISELPDRINRINRPVCRSTQSNKFWWQIWDS